MEEGPVRSQVEDGQALLTIDRPGARNALSPEVVQALRAVFARAEADPAVRVVVLTGAGDRVFSAGGDLGALPAAPAPPVQAQPEGGFLALPKQLHAPGLLLCGDGVGMVNVPALKGIHYAIE